MQKKHLVIGVILAALGVAISRGNSILVQGVRYSFILYILGMAIALFGLVVIASGTTRVTVKSLSCPNCFTLNTLDASRCKRCYKKLPSKEQ